MTPSDTLSPDSNNYIGESLRVAPIYGWGWSDDQPADFNMRLLALQADAAGAVKGGHGEIVAPGHKYNGYFVVFSLHHKGRWNFTDNIADYSICIFRELPLSWQAIAVNFTPSKLPRTYSTCGFARIGVAP